MEEETFPYAFNGQELLVTKRQLLRLKRLDDVRLAILNNDLRGMAVATVLKNEGHGGFWAVADLLLDMDDLQVSTESLLAEVKRNGMNYLNNAPAGSRSTAKH